ncbi:MAG: NAD-glutamate dehydrogenase domain-containing protein [Alphaproteobacteria bacterium]
MQETALAAHPDIAKLILGLFRVRFDPELKDTLPERTTWAAQLSKQIDDALGAVSSLDEDRVLRRIARLVEAIQRTNFYQRDESGAAKTYMSFKIASPMLADLPLPKTVSRNLGVVAASGRRALALRPRGARRPALVGPTRRFPHRSAQPR